MRYPEKIGDQIDKLISLLLKKYSFTRRQVEEVFKKRTK